MTLVTSHLNKMWTEISSSVPHYLHVGLLLSPIIYKRLLKVLCPVKCLFVKADFLKKKNILCVIFFTKFIFQNVFFSHFLVLCINVLYTYITLSYRYFRASISSGTVLNYLVTVVTIDT